MGWSEVDEGSAGSGKGGERGRGRELWYCCRSKVGIVGKVEDR